ncbi:hypothetical protein QJQ45_016735 [Haematococcus lacustris]|nr:hypothetical protein QJQ45_016735 [Haematococcus lacustris]
MVMTRSRKRLLEGEKAGVVQPAQPALQHPQQEPQPQLVLEQPLPPPPLPVHPLHPVNMTEQLLAAYAADEDFASSVDQYDQDKHGLYRTKGKNQIVVPNCQQLKARILVEMHDAQFVGHVGITETLERISRMFWWPRMRSESDWPFFLSLAEFAVNNSWQESIQSTPFLVNTGQSPLTPALLELPGEVYCPSARKLSEWWQSNVKQARHFMEQAQQRQAYLANKGRRDVEFSPGQLVLLSTKNLRLKPGKAKKLLPRFIGPFKVLEHVGPVAVRLDLPPAMARMHPVFHVALLRPYTSEHPHLPPPVDWLDEAPLYEVDKLLAHRGVRAGRARGYLCIVLQPLVSYLSSLQLAGRISTPTIPSSPLAMHRAALTPALPSKEYADDLTIVVLDRVRDGKVVVEALGLFCAAGGPALSVSKSLALPCAQPEPGPGNQEGSGPEGAGRGGRGGDGREGGGQGQVGAQRLGGGPREGGGQGQQQGGREQGGEQEPEVVIPAVRVGVPVRHLGVPLGAPSYAATSEAAFGGAAAAMIASDLPWRPQGLNLLGRVQVAQKCLASKSIYQMAFVQPSVALAQAMALAVNRFVAASDLPQERSPNSSRLYPSKAICVMPRGEGGVGLPDLGVTSTAMLAKMLAQLWSPRVRPWQSLTHSLMADPSHGLSTWVITDPTAPPSRGISPRLQAHVAALAELKLFRAAPPASQSFFSVLAETLWYNAQVRMNPAAREAAAEQGWTHVRHVREALHSPQLEGEAHWAADLVRACLPEPWQGMVDRLQPPQPEWECLRVGPGVGFVMRRTPLLQPSHWVGPNGRLYPLDPTGQGPLGAFWAEEGAAWEPAAVARLNKPSYRLTPEERATHLRPLPAQRHMAQEQAQGQELGGARGAADEGPGTWPKEEWLLGPWAHLQLDPQVWGMGTTTLLDFSVKHARVRLHQLQRVSADPLYPPSGGLWPALWGVRPPRAAGEPEEAPVADGALRELELKAHQRPSPQMRAAQQAERQLEAQQRRGGRRPLAQPAPRADTVDQLAVGVMASQPCAKVWKELPPPGACHRGLAGASRQPHGTRPPSSDAMLLLSGRPTRGENPPFQPPDSLLWLRLRLAYLGAVWRLRSSGATTALQLQQVARRVVEEVISTLTTAVKRDWHRVGRDIRVGLCGAVPSTWFKGKDPELDAAHFDQLWPEASGGWFAKQPRRERRGGQEGAEGRREGEAEEQAAQHLGEAAALAGVGAREQGAQQSLLVSAVLDQYYGDRSSFYFYHRDQPVHLPTLISFLQLPGQPGQPTDLTTPAGVKAACWGFQQHYSAAEPTGVYAAKPVDTAARATLLGSLTSHFTPTQARAAEGPDGSPMLSEEELGRAL